MSEFYLWSIGNNGYIYSLSSWNNSWTRFGSSISNVKQFRKVCASAWCVWSIGVDKELYVYIPSSDTVIRSPEIIIETQRKVKGIFSSKHLLSSDPYGFSTFNFNGKLVKTDLKSCKLPSCHWKWERDWKVTASLNGASNNEGWVFRKTQSDRVFRPNLVRQRFWRRFRYFEAFDEWISIGRDILSDHDIAGSEISGDRSMAETCAGMQDVACGGEMLPHQKDGYLSVWVLSVDGQILYRLNVHRQNPEGSYWYLVKLPNLVRPISLAVGPLGSLFFCTSLGEIYFRENISWKNVLGTSWKWICPPHDLREGERIIQLSVGIYSLWARSSLDRVWSRSNVNLHEPSATVALGNLWSLVADDIQDISSSCSEQLFVLANGGKALFYKAAKSKMNAIQERLDWSGKLPMEFRRSRDGGFDNLITISSSGLFLENDILPTNWVQSPLISIISARRFHDKIDSECDWKIKISEALKGRDNFEFKNPHFSHFTSAFEETFWSKASNCQVQADNCRTLWLPAGVVLHHKVKDSITKATMHVLVKNSHLFKLQCMPAFIELSQITCVSKIHTNPAISMANNYMSGLAMVVFLKYTTSLASSSSPSAPSTVSHHSNGIAARHLVARDSFPILFKFPSESDVEDWIMAFNFSSSIENSLSNKHGLSRVWFLNEYNEPFCNSFVEPSTQLDKWHQDGGHFRLIESGAKGSIVWAVGFNGVAWVHSHGSGGSYLSSLCSSKYNLYQVSDSRTMYIMEYQKLKIAPYDLIGEFQHYMWTDDLGNIIFDKEKVDLPTRRWRWYGEWSPCSDEGEGNVRSEGWQYASGLVGRYAQDNANGHANMRRRRWKRVYTTNLVGPWKEIRNDVVKIIDISIYPDLECGETKSYRVLAVSSTNQLLLRKGVTLEHPEGRLWQPLEMQLKIVSVSINNSGTVWVTSVDGLVARLKFSNFTDISTIGRNDWDLLRHPQPDGHFTKVSSGSNRCVWAIDRENRLWCRQFLDGSGTSSASGIGWISVCDGGIRHVSCGIGADSQISVWAVFTDGSIATRIGIGPRLPQGTGWLTRLTGLGKYVAINCA